MTRKAALAFAAVLVLIMSAVPPCAVACCMTAKVTTMHANMACCAGDGASMTPSDARAAQPAVTAAPLLPPATAVAHVVTPAASATASLPVRCDLAAAESSPPIFKTTSQYLI